MATLGMLLLFLSGTGVALASDCYSTYSYYNTQYNRLYYSSSSFYCYSGCCGGTSDAYCCPDSYVDYYEYANYVSNATGGIIAGIVIGSLVGVGLFIAFVILICVYCVNSNRRSLPGQVITTPTGAQITHVNTHTVQSGYMTQPGVQSYTNQGFIPSAGIAYIPSPVSYTPSNVYASSCDVSGGGGLGAGFSSCDGVGGGGGGGFGGGGGDCGGGGGGGGSGGCGGGGGGGDGGGGGGGGGD